MLKTYQGSPQSNYKPSNHERDLPDGSSLANIVKSFTAIVRRQLPIFLLVIPCATTLGLLYLLATPSSYTAVARMVIDTRKVPAFQQQQVIGETTIDAVAVATQVEVLMSENVSRAVIKDLKLTEDLEFVGTGAGLLGAFFNLISSTFGSGAAVSESELQRRALAAFESRRKITRVPNTYAMQISFRSLDRGKAAQIANAIADAYIVDILEAKYQSTRRASVWLQERIASLRADTLKSKQALVEFKQANNIVESSGRLMNEQQMSEVTSQLILAHASTAESKARLDRVRQVMTQEIPDASLADALKSEVIIKLRGQYLETAGRESDWSKKYGGAHLATIALRNRMLELRRSIADEMGKIAQSYESEYEIAQTREAAIQKSLESAVADSRITGHAQVQLSELESNAQTARTMYENFLQRYMEAVQEQSFPISEARLISPADSPTTRSHPNTLFVLAVTGAGGMMVAFGVAALREASDRVFRTGAQVEATLHVNCIAMLPILKPFAPPVPDEQVDAAALAKQRRIGLSDNLMRHVVDAPFSQFTELLRSLKVIADLNGIVAANRVIGFTSSLPNEGKSTIAANFASMIAHAGSRVILVDADLRNPSISRHLAPKSAAGLVEVAAGRIALNDAIWTDPATGLIFLPAGPESTKLLHPNEVLGSLAVNSLFDKLRGAYDYVIVDFPPLAPVVDTRTTTSFIDSYVYVIEWGRTRIDVVEHSLSNAREVYDRLLGVVLNKADMSVLQRYERYRTTYYYKKYDQYKNVK
ncbi:polysaccharide biosynthesis tyrosine autokinase [Methylocapsa acidiphila]|uniref:polysaccharide biosynthesis tyrosine autokinase n=1 Tax=Methylocapsa acidiphila TaxID=133552 RepID=UPI000407506E|nr:polysaccharide biosynthesis tyrosine autokinase [Methylocapsa acidiphila]